MHETTHPMLRRPLRGIALDPGLHETAIVRFDLSTDDMQRLPWGVVPTTSAVLPNAAIADALIWDHDADMLVIEAMAGIFGASTGADQVATERAGGEMICAWRLSHDPELPIYQVTRSTARAATTGRVKGIGDSQVRAALIDAYGGKASAFGVRCKACKGKGWRGRDRTTCDACGGEGWDPPRGPLHGWTGSHVFAALACAVAAAQPGGPVGDRGAHPRRRVAGPALSLRGDVPRRVTRIRRLHALT